MSLVAPPGALMALLSVCLTLAACGPDTLTAATSQAGAQATAARQAREQQERMQAQIQALRDYRHASGIEARLVVVGMVSNGFSIADPADPGMLDVVGFDTATPQLIADFARGTL